jgi:hypothetical protein
MRKNAPNSTSQPGWVVRGTHLRFSPDTAIKAMRLSQTPVDGRLLGLPGPYHRHVIGTFNTCLRVPTPRSLTDTGGGYHIENLGISTTLSRPPLSRVPLIPLMAPPNLRLSIQHLPIELQREQTLNLMSGCLHSTSTVTYHLSTTLLMVSHHKMGVRINRKEDLNVSMVPSNSYKLNAQSYGIINKAQI